MGEKVLKTKPAHVYVSPGKWEATSGGRRSSS
jgi:hypothetical protein